MLYGQRFNNQGANNHPADAPGCLPGFLFHRCLAYHRTGNSNAHSYSSHPTRRRQRFDRPAAGKGHHSGRASGVAEAEFSPPAFRGASNALTGGALNGFEVDIARHLAEQLGLELELVEAYPPVISGGDWRGEWDIALASLAPFDNSDDTSTSNIFYSQPYGYMPMGILTPAGSNIQSIAQLEGRRVGVLEHSPYQRLLTPENDPPTVYGQQLIAQPFPPLQLIVVSNLQKAIHQLGQSREEEDNPRLDAIFGPAPLFQEAAKIGLPVQLADEGKNIGVQPLVIAVVPQDGLKVERLMAEINTALDRLQRQGTLSEIYLRWYNQDLSEPP